MGAQPAQPHRNLAYCCRLGGSEAELDSKMAGVLVLRMLQAYHKETGGPGWCVGAAWRTAAGVSGGREIGWQQAIGLAMQ